VDEIGWARISRRSCDGIRRREAKVSDVGGKKTLRLSPIYYTSFAEIKGFRFRLEMTFLHPKEITKIMRYQVPGRASADPQRPNRLEPITVMMA
jgi:hypothetical protein